MNGSYKKMLCVGLVLTLLLAVGCSGAPAASAPAQTAAPATAAPQTAKPSTQPAASSAPAATESAPAATESAATGGTDLPLSDYYKPYDAPVAITAAISLVAGTKYQEGDDYQNNNWTRAWEEKLNLKVNFTVAASGADYTTMLNLAIASGQCPDIFEVPFERYHELVASNYLADMTEVFEKDLHPILKRGIEANSGVIPSITVDGKIYGIPATVNGGMDVLYARKDWVENVGYSYDSVKTIDDVIKLAYALTTDDPDQDGQNNTYGFWMEKTMTSFNKLANAYGAYPTIWVEQPDGKIVYGLTQPETKQALAVAAKMFADGVIDPEFGIKSQADTKKDFAAGTIGMYLMGTNQLAFANGLHPNKNDLELNFWRLPDQNGGVALADTKATAGTVYVAKKGFAHPEVLTKLMAFQYDMLNGDDPDNAAVFHTQVAPDGTSYMVFQQCLRFQLDSLSTNHRISMLIDEKMRAGDKSLDFNGAYSGQAGMYYTNILKYLEDPSYTAGWQNRWAFGSDGLNMTVKPLEIEENGLYKVSAFTGINGTAMIEYWTSLSTYAEEFLMQIIYNEIPVDDFDKCIETWYSMGGQAVTDEINANR